MDDSESHEEGLQRNTRRCAFCTINPINIQPGVIIHFFKFPDPGTPRRQIWIAALLELNPKWLDFRVWKETSKSMSLCSMHFKSSDYKHQLGTISTVLRAKLDPEAVPSVLGPSVYKANSYDYFKIGPQYSCRCASIKQSLVQTPEYLRKESRARLSEMELAWQMEREEDQPVFEANEVDEAVYHITEPAGEVTVESNMAPVTTKKTAKKRKNAGTPSSSPKKQAVSTPPQVNAHIIAPQKPKVKVLVHGKLVPSKPAAAVQPKNMKASTISEPSSVTNPLATVQPKCFPKSAAMGELPQKTKSITSEKAKASCFKIFLTDDGKTCYLALDTHDQELSPEQMKTAQIIAFQTAKRLGCKVTEPPQMILIKSNNSNAIDKKLIPELANTKTFNVMFKLDERPAHKEYGKQPKITDRPGNSSDSSHDENKSVTHESTNKESELPSMEDPLDLDTSGDRPSSPMDSGSSQINCTPDNVQIGESTVDSDLSQSNSTPEKDVEIVEEVDRSEPIVISDDSDCETGNDAQPSPSSKYTSVTSESHLSDLIGADPLTVILPVSQTPLPEQPKTVAQQQPLPYVPMIRSTPEKPASFSSLAPTTLPKIVGFPKPIIQLPKPKLAKGPTTPAQASSTMPAQVPAVSAPAPTMAANCAPSFITKQNADGQNETFMVLQPGTNLNDTMVGLVQLPNGQKGLLTLPASVVQSLAMNSAQAGKVPPIVCVGNPPKPKVMPVSAPASTKKVITVSAPVPTKKIIRVGMPATSKPSTPIVATSAPAAAAVASKPAGVKTTTKYETVRAKLTVPANMEYKEFQDSVANFVIEPWVKAMETNFSSDPVMTQCRVSQFTFKAINETVRLCEKLGIDKSSTKMTNLQNKGQEVNAQMRATSREIFRLNMLVEKLRKDVTKLKSEKDEVKKRAKRDERRLKRLIAGKEAMKKELEEATDAQAMVRKELCDNMTPVGLQIIQRVFDTTRGNANKQRQHTPEVKEFALRVYRASRCAYKYVQKVFPESLPAVTTIRQWMKGNFDNQDPFASAIESVASAQNLLSILQETQEGDDSNVEKMEGVDKEALANVDNSAVEKIEGQEEEENLVYYYEAQEEVDSGEQIPLEGNVGNVEMMSHNQSMPVLQVVDQTDLANVQVVWTPPQRPANYSLSEDGMSILINVSQDHEFYRNQES